MHDYNCPVEWQSKAPVSRIKKQTNKKLCVDSGCTVMCSKYKQHITLGRLVKKKKVKYLSFLYVLHVEIIKFWVC